MKLFKSITLSIIFFVCTTANAWIMGPFEAADLERERLRLEAKKELAAGSKNYEKWERTTKPSTCPKVAWFSCKTFDLYQHNHLVKPSVLRNIRIESIHGDWMFVIHDGTNYIIPIQNVLRLVERKQ